MIARILDLSINDLTSDNPISENNKTNRNRVKIGYALSGIVAAFYFILFYLFFKLDFVNHPLNVETYRG